MKTSVKILCAVFLLSAVAVAQAPQSAPAADAHFAVAAGKYVQFPFNIPAGVNAVRIYGSFKATGGTASDIFVLVMNNTQWESWLKGPCPGGTCTPENGGALYNSGQSTGGTINLNITPAPATYHLVFNNEVFEYAKTIDDNIRWEWTK